MAGVHFRGSQFIAKRFTFRKTIKMDEPPKTRTSVLLVDARRIGTVASVPCPNDILDDIDIQLDEASADAANLQLAAQQLKSSDIPVAFPTETVYGLGGDATRSAAVNGIYKAKQRPADNPLIVHFASLRQLRRLLRPRTEQKGNRAGDSAVNGECEDPIPKIYEPLISRFWPGPLTIILPNPPSSPLAPEVTAGLDTFGARMPRHILALALIKLADVPIAAPSANASTKPSPTAAEHVAYDLDGRIETIIDGGPCEVGVESTVVDGLSEPPLVLRPGGVSIEQIRECPGWENTKIGYKNVSEVGSKPKAPGMKYRHYSPKAPVILYEAGQSVPSSSDLIKYLGSNKRLGVITTQCWKVDQASKPDVINRQGSQQLQSNNNTDTNDRPGFAGMLDNLLHSTQIKATVKFHEIQPNGSAIQLCEIALGSDTLSIARGIFSALRELDMLSVDAIFVEGINEEEGDTAAAIMNRVRKAAEVKVGD